MRRLLVSLGLAAAISAGAGACAGSAPPIATAGDAARANVQLADLEHGRALLMSKCGGCHQVPLPAAHAARAWPHSLDEMAGRADLQPPQRDLIETYLVTMANAPAALPGAAR